MIPHFDSVAQKRLPLGAELQVALNLIPAHTWYAAPSGALTFLNQRGSDYLGLPQTHPLRFGIDTGAEWDSHFQFLHPGDHEETRRAWSTCLSTGCAGQVSFRFRHAEGGYRWFLSLAEPVRASDGTLLYWIGVNLDIEDRKRAEEALQRTQFYLGEGQRLAHMGSWAFNTAGFNSWSSELFHIHGLDPSGKPPTVEEFLDLVHPEDRDSMQQEIQKMLAENRGFDLTKRIVRPDGKTRYVRCVGIPVTELTFEGFVGTGIDVTEQELLTQELRREEQSLRLILDSIPGFVSTSNATGEIELVNRQILEYFGMTIEELKNWSASDNIHPDDLPRIIDAYGRSIETGQPLDFEQRSRGPDGVWRWYHNRSRPERDAEGRIIRWYYLATDIDKRKRAEHELEKAFEEIKQLKDRLHDENVVLREQIDQGFMFEEIIGSSPP